MRAVYSPMSVGDYCKALNDGLITVNDDYQRNAGIWASYAKSFFIESILLEYPIPKIFLYSKVDLRTRSTIKDIVDGQQRSHTLQSFYNKKFKLSNKIETSELRGKNYNQLPEEYQSSFISYSLPIDEFRGVQPSEIQDSFRRMNASNVPLNDEEQRNAKFQGPFKWFIQRVALHFSEQLRAIGILSRRDIIRMSDTRMYAEILHTALNGFVTTKSSQIDGLYRRFNTVFNEEDLFYEYMEVGIGQAADLVAQSEREFQRSYMFQTLVLVFLDRHFNLSLYEQASILVPEIADALQAYPVDLAILSESLRDPDNHPALSEFVASTKGTNVGRAKAVRFLYLNAALQ
ncbi:DUF262 domain-containing protein [Fulvimarina endophytica]|uniref:DUF262 domain-containing protein n=1 Tax=Fulvimarina endophytica TaxID=2293836 RepID=A0A371X290_9HYPH|nr:DUF262 domain-containing protein [Fulvimarina endophytica]RFC63337.1 DUF262 domain-containing protein [Fulvimarina endophytica]